jgi:hypothetical protein
MISSFPCLLGTAMFFSIREYPRLLFLPGYEQPKGWIAATIMVISFMLLLYWSWTFPKGIGTRRAWKNLLIILGFVVVVAFLSLLILFSPVVILLMSTPFGSHIIGG